jgi:hypothetical protein
LFSWSVNAMTDAVTMSASATAAHPMRTNFQFQFVIGL